MSIQFTMIGKLGIRKETDRFKPYEEVEYKSGWINRTLRFNVVSGSNNFLLQAKGGTFKDGHGDLFLWSKDHINAEGEKVKGSSFVVPFKDRLDPNKVAETAEWKKFVIDLEKSGRRWALEQTLNRFKEGNEISEDELKELDVDKAENLEKELEKSKKKRKEFLSQWDYAEYLYKVISSDKFKNKKFVIRGNYEKQYSEEQQRWYSNYVPTRIYLADDDIEESATCNVILLFGADALDSDSVEDNGKYYVNGFTFEYDSARKENIPAPYTVIILDDKEKDKKIKKIISFFEVEDEDEVKELGITVDLINGSPMNAIQLEDLTEEQQENIELGLTTLEDVRRELGGTIAGERVVESRFKGLSKGYSSGAKDTAYKAENLLIKPLGSKNAFEEEDEEDDNIFDNDDDDELFS